MGLLTRRASARLPVRRCALLLWLWWAARALGWPPVPPRRGSEPPLGTTSSSSESASWYLARRWVSPGPLPLLYDGETTFDRGFH